MIKQTRFRRERGLREFTWVGAAASSNGCSSSNTSLHQSRYILASSWLHSLCTSLATFFAQPPVSLHSSLQMASLFAELQKCCHILASKLPYFLRKDYWSGFKVLPLACKITTGVTSFAVLPFYMIRKSLDEAWQFILRTR